jgi:hypothetical protein
MRRKYLIDKNKSYDKKGVSLVIGVILIISISVGASLAAYTLVYIYIIEPNTIKQLGDVEKMKYAFDEMEWYLPKGYSGMYPTTEMNDTKLYVESDGWYRFSITLDGDTGPWTDRFWAWFNLETEETFLQKYY